MIRLLLNIIILFFVVQAVRSLARGGRGLLRRFFGPPERPRSSTNRQPSDPESYSKITPYDIEDAEYEELRD